MKKDKTMLTFTTQAAQGDVYLRRVDAIPEGLIPNPAVDGVHILAHSETGHHHTVIDRPGVQVFKKDAFESYLEITGQPLVLEHNRSFDTHAPIEIQPGIYRISNQREYTPEGWRRAAD